MRHFILFLEAMVVSPSVMGYKKLVALFCSDDGVAIDEVESILFFSLCNDTKEKHNSLSLRWCVRWVVLVKKQRHARIQDTCVWEVWEKVTMNVKKNT